MHRYPPRFRLTWGSILVIAVNDALPDADQVHRVVMHVPRRLHRRAEAIGNTEQNSLGLHELGDALPCPQAVLDRDYDRL